MSVRPLRDLVLVERAAQETVTPGGLTIPERSQLRQARGEVLAVGPDVESDVRPGDLVYFRVWSEKVAEIKDGDAKHLLVPEEDLLAVTGGPAAAESRRAGQKKQPRGRAAFA